MSNKITLSSVTSGYQTTSKINDNFEAVEEAFDNTLSRDGSTPNQMEADFDMNSHRIFNLGQPTDDNDAVRLIDLQNVAAPDSVIFPSVASHSGEFLTNNGSTLSWSSPPASAAVYRQNLLNNSDLSICSLLSMVRVGSPVAISSFATATSAGSGLGQFNSASSETGVAGSLRPGKLCVIEGSSTPHAPYSLQSFTVTSTNRITGSAGSFTGLVQGDVCFIDEGGTNTSPRCQYRISATDSDTYIELQTAISTGLLVNETATFNLTFYAGGYAVDPTVNGFPAAGRTDIYSIIGYPLKVLVCNTGSFVCSLRGSIDDTAGSTAAQAWEVVRGDDGYGTSDGPDGWEKSTTMELYRLYDYDWDGTTNVTKSGCIWANKFIKRAAGTLTVLKQNLTETYQYTSGDAPTNARLKEFQGKTITFGSYLWPTTTSTLRLKIYDGVTTTYSSYATTTGAYTWKEVSVAIDSAATGVWVSIESSAASGEVGYVTQPMVAYGTEIGEGKYVRSNGYSPFVSHPNFFPDYINGTVGSDARVIRIEQESCGVIPEGMRAIAIGVEGTNYNIPRAAGNSGLTVWESSQKRLPSVTFYDTWGTDEVALTTGASTIAANLTRYVGRTGLDATETNVRFKVSRACKLGDMYFMSSAAPGAAKTFIATLVKNGSDTTCTATISGASDTTAVDTTHDITFAAGDTISVKIVTLAGAATARFDISFTKYDLTHPLAVSTGTQVVGKNVENISGGSFATDCIYIEPGSAMDARGVNIDMTGVIS